MFRSSNPCEESAEGAQPLTHQLFTQLALEYPHAAMSSHVFPLFRHCVGSFALHECLKELIHF
jgi:hypothetical protein